MSRVTQSCIGSLKQKSAIWSTDFLVSLPFSGFSSSHPGSEFALPCLSRTLLETSMATSLQEQWADVLRPVLVYLVNWKGILTKGNLIHLL